MTHDFISSPSISLLELHHAGEGLKLSTQAGWNQTLFDWQTMLRYGRGYGIFEGNDLVATTLYLSYPPIAWIGMVLVREDRRRRGLATRLMERCLADIEREGLSHMLDATEAGREVYLRLGFEDGFSITRFLGHGTGKSSRFEEGATVIYDLDLPQIYSLDRRIFGGDRSPVLDALIKNYTGVLLKDTKGQLTGFGLSRPGRLAAQIGPIEAYGEAVANRILASLLAQQDGPVFLDIPDEQAAWQNVLQSIGFTPHRRFVRMGRDIAGRAPSALFAIAGPEWG